MTGNDLLRNARATWSKLKAFYATRLHPFLKTARFSCSCCRKTLKFFLNTPHFPTVVIAVSVMATVFANVTPPDPNRTSPWATIWQPGDAAPAASNPPPAGTREIIGFLQPGDSLSTSFKRCQVPESVGQQVIRALRGIVDFRELRPRDRFALRLDPQGELQECTYESGPLNVHKVTRHDDGTFYAERLNVPLERRTVKVSGAVNESLYDAFISSREEPRLLYTFADIFASRIDFNTEVQTGDRFSMVFEKYYKGGEFVGYGKILMAEYDRKDEAPLAGFYYTPTTGESGSFFDRNGEELGTSFIRSPVPMARVSSGFTMRRLHPILRFTRPHPAVDLAAPTGTPIMAAADGKVTSLGWNGGYGKQIVIDHGNGYRTHYSHLSKFRSGLTEGSRVRQKEIIGYVGSTGLSTGPHLDYRMEYNRSFVNPFAMEFRPRSVLRGQELARFRQEQEVMARLSGALDDPKVVMVNSVTVTPESKFTFL
jgi:murein DD-endopeptidase MepM/ murein hydrolase activator NlpD